MFSYTAVYIARVTSVKIHCDVMTIQYSWRHNKFFTYNFQNVRNVFPASTSLLLTICSTGVFFLFIWSWISKIEKVPRGIRGEKSSKDMASSRNLVSTIGALASPKMGTEPGVRKGKRSLLACQTRCKCSMETTHNRWRSGSVSRSWNWWSDWLGSHCWSRIRMSFNIRERDTSYCWIRSPYRP